MIVPAKVDGRKIIFELPEKYGDISGVFEGEIYKNSLRGHFINGALNKSGESEFILVKKSSYWQ